MAAGSVEWSPGAATLPGEARARARCSSSSSSRRTTRCSSSAAGAAACCSAVAARAAPRLRGGHRPLGADGRATRARATGAGSRWAAPRSRGGHERRPRRASRTRASTRSTARTSSTSGRSPRAISREIRRVLRPGGSALLGFLPVRGRHGGGPPATAWSARVRLLARSGLRTDVRAERRAGRAPAGAAALAERSSMMTATLDARRGATPSRERLLGILNGGALALMISIGHRTGLFDVMAALAARDAAKRSPTRRASRSATCASGSARWSTGGVVEYEPRGRTLPPAARARRAAHARRAPEQPGRHGAVGRRCSASVEDEVLQLLRARRRRALRGLPALPRGDGRGERPDRRGGALRDDPAARAGPASSRLAARHRRARRRLRQRAGAEPAGAALPEEPLRRLRPARPRPIAAARAEARATTALRNVRFEVRDVAELERGAALRPGHRVRRDPRPGAAGRRCSRAIARALRPDGVFLMQDIARHRATSRRTRAIRSAPSSTRSRACTA